MRTATVALFLTLAGCTPAGADLVGRADAVHDGDTLTLAGAKVRLWGIDAPELAQECADSLGRRYRCGVDAREALGAVVGKRTLTCRERDRDRHGRIVASCEVQGRDVAQAMVQFGLALDYPRYSLGRYAHDQRQAREGRAGMWEGRFEMPWDWRRRKR